MHPNKELAQYFLQQIHHYYPIGLPYFSHDYPGFQELVQIQQDKFEAIEREEPKAWYELVDAVRTEWSDYQVFNSVAAQFPCYEVSISLADESKTGLHMHSSLTLSVSLLVPYFSIVVVDVYAYRGQEHSGVSHQVVCSGLLHHLELDAKIEALKRIVNKYFTEYKYANHDVLFNYKIHGGYPYKGSYDDLGQYTVYDYLFSAGLFRQRYTVAH
ncbi:MAG: hypothetical protein WCF67_14990 [Chitinophagaceae bacterium]